MSKHKLSLIALPDLYSICRLDNNAPIPAWASSGALYSITRTCNELSVVCPQSAVPDGVRCEPGWRCLQVAGTMPVSVVGVLASLTAPLAEARISVFAISTFDTDYLLVKGDDFDDAIAAWKQAGHGMGDHHGPGRII